MMEIFKREFLVYRIITGKLKFKDGIIIRSPSLDVIYEAAEIYKRFYERAAEEGLMNDDDLKLFLIKIGIWNDEKENLITKLPEQIDHWKEELYKAYYQTDRKKTIRQYLDTAKSEFAKLTSIRQTYGHMTNAGVANYAKLQYIIENSVYKGRKRYKWDNYSSYSLMSFYQDNFIKEEDIRFISHTSPWFNIWQSGKKIGNLFGKPAVELDYDQQRLVMWSSMYDNINEQTDCPPDDIIEDDDALDGWMIVKKRERGQNAVKLTDNEKINNAQEVYVPASNTEDAKKIDNLNSAYSKAIKKQRFQVIEKYGELREQDLPDIKQEVMMEMNRRQKGG